MIFSDKRKLLKSGFELPILGMGSAPLMLSNDKITNTSAEITLKKALHSKIKYFDTAPWYGLGRSELRLGNVLRDNKNQLKNLM